MYKHTNKMRLVMIPMRVKNARTKVAVCSQALAGGPSGWVLPKPIFDASIRNPICGAK
jgi:hypothetical protein